MIKYWKSTKGR